MMVLACLAPPFAFPQPQESVVGQMKEKLSKTGVFFRADTPSVAAQFW